MFPSLREAPVLPPLPQPTPRVGRVRIIADDLSHSGYLDRELSVVNHQFMLTERPSQALTVAFEPVKGGFYHAKTTVSTGAFWKPLKTSLILHIPCRMLQPAKSLSV